MICGGGVVPVSAYYCHDLYVSYRSCYLKRVAADQAKEHSIVLAN